MTNQESNLALLSKLVHSLEVKQDAFIREHGEWFVEYQQGYFDALEYMIERLTKEYNLIKGAKDAMED